MVALGIWDAEEQFESDTFYQDFLVLWVYQFNGRMKDCGSFHKSSILLLTPRSKDHITAKYYLLKSLNCGFKKM